MKKNEMKAYFEKVRGVLENHPTQWARVLEIFEYLSSRIGIADEKLFLGEIDFFCDETKKFLKLGKKVDEISRFKSSVSEIKYKIRERRKKKDFSQHFVDKKYIRLCLMVPQLTDFKIDQEEIYASADML